MRCYHAVAAGCCGCCCNAMGLFFRLQHTHCCGCNTMLHTSLNTKFRVLVTKRDNSTEFVSVKCITEDDKVRPYGLEQIFSCLLVLKHKTLQFLPNRRLTNQHRDLTAKQKYLRCLANQEVNLKCQLPKNCIFLNAYNKIISVINLACENHFQK